MREATWRLLVETLDRRKGQRLQLVALYQHTGSVQTPSLVARATFDVLNHLPENLQGVEPLHEAVKYTGRDNRQMLTYRIDSEL